MQSLKTLAISFLLFSSQAFAQSSYNWEADLSTETLSIIITSSNISAQEIEDKQNSEEHITLNFCSKEENIFGIIIKELYGACKLKSTEFMDNNVAMDFVCENSKANISADLQKDGSYKGNIDYFLKRPDISEKTLTQFKIIKKNICE